MGAELGDPIVVRTYEGDVGQTRQIVGPVLIWLLVAATIGALTDVPSWSANFAEALAVDPWLEVGQIGSPVVMILLALIYLGALLRTWTRQESLPFIRLLYGAGTTVVVTLVCFMLQTTYGKPRPCQVLELGGSCPPDTNFSYPSTYAVVAFALAVSIAYATPWLSYLAFPLALLEGLASIMAGEQYPHDVLVGAVLGALGGIGLLHMFSKVQASMAAKLTARKSANHNAS